MAVVVLELLEALINYVITEISESYMCLSIVFCQQFLEGLVRIGNLEMPLIHQYVVSSSKLFLRDSSFTIHIHFLEVFPKLVVESQINEQKFKNCFGYEVFSIRFGLFNFGTRSLVCSHNDRLGFKQLRKV